MSLEKSKKESPQFLSCAVEEAWLNSSTHPLHWNVAEVPFQNAYRSQTEESPTISRTNQDIADKVSTLAYLSHMNHKTKSEKNELILEDVKSKCKNWILV